MTSNIYLLNKDGSLVTMSEQPYDSEDLLQELLAKYPSLLAGDQVNPTAPRQWLLVRREAGIPGEEGRGDRWSVDHLFLDQDAIPTLIEVKRSTDTRIRREVVGQMLDYAANAVAYWPVDRIRNDFESECQSSGLDPEDQVRQLVGAEDTESFWSDVKTNLQAGRIRMVFVADVIPPELRRVVEFLNEQMDPAEVLALEVRQYVGGERSTLVPRVVGQTAQAQQKKSGSRPGRQWDEPSFFAELEMQHGAKVSAVARQLLDWAQSRKLTVWWGKGARSGSFFPLIEVGGQTHWTFSVWTYGTIEIQFQVMKEREPYRSEESREELRRKLNAVPGVEIPADGIGRRPSVAMAALAEAESVETFVGVMDEFVERVRASVAD